MLVAGQIIRPGYPWLLRQRQALMLAEARAALTPMASNIFNFSPTTPPGGPGQTR